MRKMIPYTLIDLEMNQDSDENIFKMEGYVYFRSYVYSVVAHSNCNHSFKAMAHSLGQRPQRKGISDF